MKHHRPIGWIDSVQYGSSASDRIITAPKHATSDGIDNKWCGPNAVSALTGCTVELAETLFQQHRPVTVQYTHRDHARVFAAHIKGTNTGEMRSVLAILGFKMQSNAEMRGATFAAWTARRFAKHKPDPRHAYLVNYADHWGVVQGDWFCDNQRGLVRLAKATSRRGVIEWAHRVYREAVIDFDAVHAEYARMVARRVKQARRNHA
jgi:hypothetical protein